jgi:molybdate transport system ATP-binding protein
MSEAGAEGLCVTLGQTAPIPLDVALTCGRGEALAIVGPSGAGKSTVLRAIAGLYRPRTGRIDCAGKTWFDAASRIFVPPHRRAVGLVFQSYALFPHMTALDNITAAMGHRPPEERNRKAQALVDLVHLSGLEMRRPAELSGGQQQRVAVARALARDPSVLLLDEPFSAVDKVTRGKLYRELAELRRSLAIPIILITHDFDEAARLADRMCLLDHGRVVQRGTPHEILARPATVEAARLVDLKNLFEGRIVAHENGATMIGWSGRLLSVSPARPELPIGSPIAWTVPSTQVLLHREEKKGVQGMENLLDGTIAELVALSEATSIIVAIQGAEERLTLTIPAHYALRTRLSIGTEVTVAPRAEGIHLIALG